MAKRRAVKGVKLLSIKMIGLGAPPMDANVVKLREYVTQVEYRGDTAPLSWDCIPDESESGFGEQFVVRTSI